MNTTQTRITDKSETPMTKAEVKKLLRDAAYVLQLTRKVKAEILAAQPESPKADARKAPELAAGLGV